MRRFVAAIGLVLMGLLVFVPALGAAGERATGTLIDSTGATIGQVELTQEASAVRVIVRLNAGTAVAAGNHGIHFHAVGQCGTPDFASAGAHFNPTNKQHGLNNPNGAHLGDLLNLPIDNSTLNQNGVGYTWVTTTSFITLTAGASSIFDADGTALVIHANPDDQTTDPSGNSGGRIACAVLAQQPGLPNTGLGGMAGGQGGRGLAAVIGLGALALIMLANTVVLRRSRRA